MCFLLANILLQLAPILEKGILLYFKEKLYKLPSATKPLEILPSATHTVIILKETNMNWILLIKTLISSIQAIEALMGKEPGSTKLDAAIAITEAVVGPVAEVLPAVQAVAATVVTGLHAAGVFVKADNR